MIQPLTSHNLIAAAMGQGGLSIQRGELSIDRVYSGASPLGAIGALLLLALIALLVIQVIGPEGRAGLFGTSDGAGGAETVVSGSHVPGT